MATKSEIVDAINAGVNRVESTFVQLPEEHLEQQVHDELDGWNAREVLAHLANRMETYDMLFGIALDSSGAPPGGFNIDRWNQRLVEQRAGCSREELIREFKSVHAELIKRVVALRDDHLKLPVVFPNRDTNLGDVLLGSGGMHSIQHAEEVAKALGMTEDD